jgi:hypothetical protein
MVVVSHHGTAAAPRNTRFFAILSQGPTKATDVKY